MGLLTRWGNQWKSYNQNIRSAIYANVFSQVGLGIFMIIYNFYIRELKYSDQVNGQVISMTSLATAIILIPAGILSDRIGRKKVIFIGIFLTGFILIFRSVMEYRTLLIASAFLCGLTQAFIQVSSVPLLAENSEPNQRVSLFSLHYGMNTVSNVLGNLIGGFLTDILGTYYSPLLSIRITLLLGSIIFLLGLIPTWKIKDQPQRRAQKVKNFNAATFFKAHKKNLKIIIAFATAQLLIGFGAGLVIPYLNLYFADRFHASNSTIGLIISLGQAATAIAMFIGPIAVRKVGEVKAVVFFQLSSLPFLILTGYTHNLLFAAIGFLFRQALMNAGNPIQMSLMMAKVDDSVKGFANSVNQMVFSLGWALMGPVSMTIVAKNGSYQGYAMVFTITCLLYLVGSVYFFIVFHSLNKNNRQISVTKLAK